MKSTMDWGGVDDAVGVADVDGEAAEEPLVDAVEEVLLVGEAGEGAGGGASMTRSTSTAMTLRRVNSGLSKMLRKRCSVRRCWMSISSTASSKRRMSGSVWVKNRLRRLARSCGSPRLARRTGCSFW